MEQREYIEHLPEIYRAPSRAGEESFLRRYLRVFEALLSGRADASVGGQPVEGLQQHIGRLSEYLDPGLVPVDDPVAERLSAEFLTYLARWVALTLDQNWDLGRQREWLRRIVPLYKRRGTRDGLQQYLEMFVGSNQVQVDEPGGLVIAVTSTVAVDTFVGDPPPYCFRVFINYAFAPEGFDIEEWRNIRRGARAIVDLEKPAHTDYSLYTRTPGFIVAERATVGADTLLWHDSRPIHFGRC